VGVIPDEDLEPAAFRGEGVMPISYAAVEAARMPGTEVDGTEVGGAKRGSRGRWVLIRHRRRRPQGPSEAPEHDGEPTEDASEDAATG
jgi:hypothetical protein